MIQLGCARPAGRDTRWADRKRRHSSDTLPMAAPVHRRAPAATKGQRGAQESQILRGKPDPHAIGSGAGALLTMEVLYQLS